jgi:NitT/TauT family transport system substrate-binding protein
LLVAALMLATACSSSKASDAGTGPSKVDSVTLRLGYFPNVTHAPAIIGVQQGIFAKDLGANVKVSYKTYNSGTEETNAILAGALDAAFVGPNPAINAYQKSGGTLIRVVAGTASGGAFLVVEPGITSVAQLKGKKLATPSLGNTQDVALRTWLKSNGLDTTLEGGGDVSILPQDNSTTVTAFQTGAIDGAWVPEPYATKLRQAGGIVLVDEATLWPQGKYVTTQLAVTTKFLADHPDVVANLIKGLAESIDLTDNDKVQAEKVVAKGITDLTGKEFKVSLVASSFAHIKFTLDPIASSLRKDAASAKALGLIKSDDLTNLYDLSLLNKLLQQRGEPAITP